jgi:hypothetical protein
LMVHVTTEELSQTATLLDKHASGYFTLRVPSSVDAQMVDIKQVLHQKNPMHSYVIQGDKLEINAGRKRISIPRTHRDGSKRPIFTLDGKLQYAFSAMNQGWGGNNTTGSELKQCISRQHSTGMSTYIVADDKWDSTKRGLSVVLSVTNEKQPLTMVAGRSISYMIRTTESLGIDIRDIKTATNVADPAAAGPHSRITSGRSARGAAETLLQIEDPSKIMTACKGMGIDGIIGEQVVEYLQLPASADRLEKIIEIILPHYVLKESEAIILDKLNALIRNYHAPSMKATETFEVRYLPCIAVNDSGERVDDILDAIEKEYKARLQHLETGTLAVGAEYEQKKQEIEDWWIQSWEKARADHDLSKDRRLQKVEQERAGRERLRRDTSAPPGGGASLRQSTSAPPGGGMSLRRGPSTPATGGDHSEMIARAAADARARYQLARGESDAREAARPPRRILQEGSTYRERDM